MCFAFSFFVFGYGMVVVPSSSVGGGGVSRENEEEDTTVFKEGWLEMKQLRKRGTTSVAKRWFDRWGSRF